MRMTRLLGDGGLKVGNLLFQALAMSLKRGKLLPLNYDDLLQILSSLVPLLVDNQLRSLRLDLVVVEFLAQSEQLGLQGGNDGVGVDANSRVDLGLRI
jgi:hypothetical protein